MRDSLRLFSYLCKIDSDRNLPARKVRGNSTEMRKLLQSRNPDVRLWLLLGLWWIANLIQAGCTELANDEAYYHMFSRSLAWGYFDHPPMTALLVRLGSFWGGEFGVRFFFTLLQPLYLYLLWRIVRPDSATVRDAGLFVLIAAAMPILQLYGFLAVPDGPLMLFTALFLWCYKRLTEDDRWSHALWLGVAMAALAYSKYHGALVVLLTVLSNLRLLRNPKFYAACVVTLLLILPHLGWQSGHDWVSFRYHLAGRNKDFQFSFVTEYLLNLLAIFNPLLFPVFVAVWWKTRAETPVLRALNFMSAGFVLFFLSTTLRGYVQPQWEIPVAFGVIALVRIEMIFNPLGLRFEVFDNRTSYGRIAQEAAGAPVIFDGQYTAAAKYAFYTGGQAYAQPSIYYRTSQYELRDDDDRMAGGPVLIQVWDSVPGSRDVQLPNGRTFRYLRCGRFVPVRRIAVETGPLPSEVRPGDTLRLSLTLRNPYPYDYRFDGDSVKVGIVWRNLSETTRRYDLPEVQGLLPAGGTLRREARFVVPELPERTWQVGFTVSNLPVTTWFNGPTERIRTIAK